MGGAVQTIIAGASLRMAQALVLAAPTLLFGVIAAGVLGGRVGASGIRRMFGDGRSWLPRTLAWAALLPVCSLGVLPVLRQLRAAGVGRGPLLTFALTAPLINPFSILYGLTIIPPQHLGLFVVSALSVGVLAAVLPWRTATRPLDLTAGSQTEPEPEPETKIEPEATSEPDAQSETASATPAEGGSGLLAALSHSARLLTGPSFGDLAVGIAGVGLLAAVLPAGSLMMSMTQGNRLAPLRTVPIAILSAISPERAQSIVGEMFEHTCSTGANFLLYLLGAGMNLGLLWFLGRTAGYRWTARWLAVLLGLGLIVGYALDFGYPVQGMESGHTHVFDNFSTPFHGYSHPDPWELVRGKLAETAAPTSLGALALLVLLGLLGLALKVGRLRRIWEWLERRASGQAGRPAGVFSRSLPPGVLAVAGVIGALALGVAGALVYYPPPEEVLADMRLLRADALTAVTSGSKDHALKYLDQWETLLVKLSIGTRLRRGSLPTEQRAAIDQLRDDLKTLRRSIAGGADLEAPKAQVPRINASYDRCRQAFAPSR